MKIWEQFKECLQRKFYGGNIFTCKGTLPKTDDEIYWGGHKGGRMNN
jgi:hypothetical protein